MYLFMSNEQYCFLVVLFSYSKMIPLNKGLKAAHRLTGKKRGGGTEDGEGTGKSRQPNPCLRMPPVRCGGGVCAGLPIYVGDTKG